MVQRPCKPFPVNPELEPEGVLFPFFSGLVIVLLRPTHAIRICLYTDEIFPARSSHKGCNCRENHLHSPLLMRIVFSYSKVGVGPHISPSGPDARVLKNTPQIDDRPAAEDTSCTVYHRAPNHPNGIPILILNQLRHRSNANEPAPLFFIFPSTTPICDLKRVSSTRRVLSR